MNTLIETGRWIFVITLDITAGGFILWGFLALCTWIIEKISE